MVDDERVPSAKRRSEQRKRDAALRYYLEMDSRKVGWQDPALVYGEEKNLFRFRDGRFAFSVSTLTGRCLERGAGRRDCERCARRYRLKTARPAISATPRSATAPTAR
jgi:hypothetical protein